MAGGMLPKPGSLTLAERAELSRSSRGHPPPAQPAAGTSQRDDLAATATAEGGRHCWVSGLPGQPGRWPGLLVAWQRQGPSWSGRVVYAVVDDGQVVLVEAWVPAERLQPVTS